MIKFHKITKDNYTEWNNLLNNTLHLSYLSSISHIYSKESIGKKIETYIFEENNKYIGGAHYSIKSFGKNIIKVADLVSGILFNKKYDTYLFDFVMNHFIQWSKKNNASYIRYFPWLPYSIDNKKEPYVDDISINLKKNGFNLINKSQHTYWIDLTKSEEQILSQFKRQTRYEVKKAQKSLLEINRYDTPNDEIFEAFWKLYHTLGNKKGFGTLGKDHFKQKFFSLMETGIAHLFVAKFKNTIVNMSLMASLGRGVYLYGAMDPDFKKLEGCPSPGQIAQWEMIKFAKSRQLPFYDMGFCPGPVPYKEHPEYAIWRFKYAFGGKHVQFLPTFGKVLKPIRGILFQWFKYKKF